MPVLPFEFNFRNPEILIQLGNTKTELARLNEQAKRIPNQRILLDFLSTKEGVWSNEIENIHTTVADVFLAELEREELRKQPDKETIYYKEAINYWFDRVTERGFLSVNDFIEINKILLRNDAGIVSNPNKVIRINETGEILYTPPQGIDNIERLLHNLEIHYNRFDNETEVDPLLKIAMLHYQFEAIHPFGDGNGRTGRILAVLYLVLHGKLDLPILFLSDFISRRKSGYYSFLRRMDRGEPVLEEFTLWMLMGMEWQARETCIVIKRIESLREETTEFIRSSANLEKIYRRDLIDFLFVRPYYRIEELEKTLGVHRNTATAYLNSLESEGLLRSFKIGRDKYFFFEKYLNTLKSDSRES